MDMCTTWKTCKNMMFLWKKPDRVGHAMLQIHEVKINQMNLQGLEPEYCHLQRQDLTDRVQGTFHTKEVSCGASDLAGEYTGV